MFILWKNEEKNLLHHHWKLNASKRIAHKIPLVNWFKLYLRTYCPACSVNTQQIKDYVIHGKVELFLVDKKTSKERLTLLESFICWKKITLSRVCSIKDEFEALLQLTLLKSFSKVAFNNPVYNYINEPCSNFFPLINGTNLSKFLLQGIQTEVSQSAELPFASRIQNSGSKSRKVITQSTMVPNLKSHRIQKKQYK